MNYLKPDGEVFVDNYIENNRDLWNELTPIHAKSAFYDIEGFKKGKNTLKSIELDEVGDVHEKTLLHLQCHFGLDTLSWARLGAKVMGVDFSDKSIKLARALSDELGIQADFICSDIYRLPDVLKKKFDIVFTGRGALCWLPDLEKWAEVISHFISPGGTFYIVEGHPLMMVFDDAKDAKELKLRYTYFHKPEPDKWDPDGGDYADKDAKIVHPSYEWSHKLSDIVNALIGVGLRIEFLNEFSFITYRQFPFMEELKPGHWRVKGDPVPLTFSIKATKI